MGHEERTHALFGASSAHRWLSCPGSLLLEKDFPDTKSEAAAEGTLAHELAELKARNYFNHLDVSKKKITYAVKKMKENERWDDEMLVHADTYIDYIRDVSIKMPSTPVYYIEHKVYYRECMPDGHKEDGFGTADCVMIQGNSLYILDFKYGKSPDGRVPAEKNPQMMLYALGVYEACRMIYQIQDIHLAIIQPRLSDGISEWSCTLEELLRFRDYVKERAELAVSGNAEYNPGPKTCKYCRAKARCRARSEYNVRLAFSQDLGKLPPLISNEEMGKYLLQGEDVEKWMKDLKETALSKCLAGEAVPGWKAVEGQGSRDWTDMDAAFEKLTKGGIIAEEVLWEKKPLTLAQVEKAIGKKDFADAVGDLVIKNPGKPTLVKESDRREAVTNKVSAKEAFKEDK